MSDSYIAVADILIDIEYQLRRVNLWQSQRPSMEALASQQPFCVDTLAFHEWLQFVFLPRMHALVEQRLQLPAACAIAPMAEESLKADVHAPLLDVLRDFDRLFG